MYGLIKNFFTSKKLEVMETKPTEEVETLQEESLVNVEKKEEFELVVEPQSTIIEDDSYLLTDPRVVGWLSVQEQELLFTALLLFYQTNQTILDVGCGRADLYGFMKRIFQTDEILYTGMDMNPNIIKIAKRKYPDVNVISEEFLKDDVNDSFDWVVGSGLFNLNDYPNMFDYAKNVVDKMYSKSNLGIAFNVLIGYPEELSEDDKNQLVCHNPSEWLDYLINKYSKVICRHDYMSGDATFIIFK